MTQVTKRMQLVNEMEEHLQGITIVKREPLADMSPRHVKHFLSSRPWSGQHPLESAGMEFSSQVKTPLALGAYLESRGRTQLPNCRHPFPLEISLGVPPTSLEMHGCDIHAVLYVPILADVLGISERLEVSALRHLNLARGVQGSAMVHRDLIEGSYRAVHLTRKFLHMVR